MGKKASKQKTPLGWTYSATDEDDYEVGLDTKEKHSGSRSGYLEIRSSEQCAAQQSLSPNEAAMNVGA